MVQGISQSDVMLDSQELKKGLKRIGLTLSDSEIDQLNLGYSISLESMELGVVGSAFVLASAIFSQNFGKRKKPVTFRELPETLENCSGFSGIPIYCWMSELSQKLCLCLSINQGIPALQISSYFPEYQCQPQPN